MNNLQKQDKLIAAIEENTKAVNELKAEMQTINKKMSLLSLFNFNKKGDKI